MQEVWFSGHHSGNERVFVLVVRISNLIEISDIDVGGGAERLAGPLAAKPPLTNKALRWMIRQFSRTSQNYHNRDEGGGNESLTRPLVEKPTLANIPLRWMIRQCLESKINILFNPSALNAIGIQPMTADDTGEVRDENPIDRDKNDALCEPHSPFKGINAWWVFELIPMRRNLPVIENGKIVEGKWKRKIRQVVP